MKKSETYPFFAMLLTGFFMGIAGIAPGISGGAVAVMFGLYEPIVSAVGTIWVDFRKKALFLLPLGIGAAVGMLLFGRLIHYLLDVYSFLTCSIFVGLIGGTLPSVFREACKGGFRFRYLSAMLLCAAAVVFLSTLRELQYTGGERLPYWIALFCGAVLGLGSVLPGTSMSFLLMALGVYKPLLHAVEIPDIGRLLMVGIGFCAAFFAFARVFGWLYKRVHGWMSFAVAGMLLGSVAPVIPIPQTAVDGAELLLAATLSAGVSYGLLRIKKNFD